MVPLGVRYSLFYPKVGHSQVRTIPGREYSQIVTESAGMWDLSGKTLWLGGENVRHFHPFLRNNGEIAENNVLKPK